MSSPTKHTQADRRAKTRGALLESAARGLSRNGYSDLVLEQVARDAGYTRGALYHLFPSKQDLVLSVVEWVEESWYTELGVLFEDEEEPVGTLLAVARGHAIFCRRDIARVMMTLRVEFSDREHPVGRAVTEVINRLVADCERLIAVGQEKGAIPTGPPPAMMARAFLGALEGVVIALAGQAPFDAALAERVTRGVLGVEPDPQQEAWG